MDLLALNADETLYVSGEIDDWDIVAEHGIDTIIDMDGSVDAGLPQAANSILYGAAAVAYLRERRPGVLFNENFAVHVATLPARRIRIEPL